MAMNGTATGNGTVPRVAELAAIIKRQTDAVSNFLQENGRPEISQSSHAGPATDLPPHLRMAQNAVLEACDELQALMAGPQASLNRLLSPVQLIAQALHGIARFGIAAKLGVDEEITFEELAKRCSIPAGDCRRLVRMAIVNWVFVEPRKGYVAHNALSRVIHDDPLVSQWIKHSNEEMRPATVKLIDAMTKWPGSEEIDETGFMLAHGITFWDALKQTPERTQSFVDGMVYLHRQSVFDVAHLVRDIGWTPETTPRKLVDVGGSHGNIDMHLLRAFPSLTCVVQDLPEVAESASVPADLEGRLSFVAHDFFTAQPVRDADVYFVRGILHDWSDKYAVRIIKALVPAMRKGVRVIANEMCFPEPGAVSHYHMKLLRGFDLAMKQAFNAKERDAEEWTNLFAAADPHFKITRIGTSPGSLLAVIEATWTGD